jgi:hypothetical protein
VHVLISTRLYDGSNTLIRDTHESVRVAARAHGVDCDGHASVCAVLETDREGYTGGEFAMELRLGSACTDGTPRDKIVEILRRYGIEKLRTNGHAEMGEITKKLAGGAKPFVYLKRTIYIGVIDEAFPANCCARFLCVGRREE